MSSEQGFVKSFLCFLDNNVLFKKPLSCLFALISLLIPLAALVWVIQSEIFSLVAGSAEVIFSGLLILVVLVGAGIFGFLIWWHRRIVRDESGYYNNFKCFIRTLSEWLGVLIAIIGCAVTIILLLLFRDFFYLLSAVLPQRFLAANFLTVIIGPVTGFLIIIVTKILLFLLDLLVWLLSRIWGLFVRLVMYAYRCVLNISGVAEKHSSILNGVVWLLAAAVVIIGLVMCFRYTSFFLNGVITLALGLGFMVFLFVIRRRLND